MRVLVIIPAYNEEKSILSTVKSLKDAKVKGHTLDYVVINDGSKDNTKQVCLDNHLNFINLPINLGIGGAVQTGYKYAYYNNYDIAIQFDGDGQHDAAYISSLINEIEHGNDIVIGSRFISKLSEFRSTGIRRIGINFLSFLIKLCTGKRIYDPTSGFRACNTKIIKDTDRSEYEKQLNGDEEILILYTCYPVDTLASTPDRYFVFCELVSGPKVNMFE